MKLLDKRYDEEITCPACGGKDFTDFDMRTKTTTYQIWCEKEGCKTDLLIPVKDIKRGLIISV